MWLVCWYFGVWLCAVTCGYCGCVSDFGRVDCDGVMWVLLFEDWLC